MTSMAKRLGRKVITYLETRELVWLPSRYMIVIEIKLYKH